MVSVNACPGLEEKASKATSNSDDQQVMHVAIFLYDGVEILDFSGPAEVFAVSGYRDKDGKYIRAFKVYTVAHTKETLTSQGFLKVIPDYAIANAPIPDIVVLPGGATGKSRKTPEVIEWIKAVAPKTKSNDVCLYWSLPFGGCRTSGQQVGHHLVRSCGATEQGLSKNRGA